MTDRPDRAESGWKTLNSHVKHYPGRVGLIFQTGDLAGLGTDQANGADDEPQSRTVTLHTTDLLPVDEGHQLEAPGSWVHEYQFAKAVQEALTRTASRLAASAEVETEPRLGGQRPDAIVKLGDHLIVVEVKRTAQTSTAVNQLASYLLQVRERNPDASVGGMLVLQSMPRAQIAQELRDRGLAAVDWKTPRDDSKLAEALTRLLEAA